MLNLRVVSVNSSLLLSLKKKADGSLYAIKGCEQLLLQILSEKIPFSYTLLYRQDHVYGSIDSTGRWTGMIGMLERNEADIAIGWMSITHDRLKVLDYSFPYFIGKNEIVTQSPKLLHNEIAFLYPFHYMVWIFILASIPLSALFVSTLKRLNYFTGCEVKRSPSTFAAELGNITALLLNQGSSKRYVTSSIRIFMCMWRLASLVLGFSYSCTLLSNLVAPLKEAPLKNIHDLRNAVIKGEYKFGVINGSLHHTNLMAHNAGDMKDLADHVLSHPENIVNNSDEALYRITMEKFAIQGFHLNTVFAGSKYDLSNFHTIPDSTGFSMVGVAFRKNFHLMKTVNRIILRITESGIYRKQLEDMIFWAKLKGKHHNPENVVRALSLKDVDALLVILALGLTLSTCCLFAEICYKKFFET